jgi:hypothetical protein
MRVVVSSAERTVHLKAKGSGKKTLRRLERTALRLLAAAPEPEPRTPFGFAVSSDTELSGQQADEAG